MFEEQESKMAETVKSATEVINKGINKLSEDVIKSNENLIKLTNDVNAVKDSIETRQAIIEKKKKRKKNGEITERGRERKTRKYQQFKKFILQN